MSVRRRLSLGGRTETDFLVDAASAAQEVEDEDLEEEPCDPPALAWPAAAELARPSPCVGSWIPDSGIAPGWG